jgi:hypothetical protein
VRRVLLSFPAAADRHAPPPKPRAAQYISGAVADPAMADTARK